MLKPFTVLFVLGLGLGLWIGFNPQAHERTIQSWNETRASFITLQAKALNTMHSWSISSKPNKQAGSQTFTAVWKQTTSIFTAIWDGVRHIWLEIQSQLHMKM
jgi:hypothetical protein